MSPPVCQRLAEVDLAAISHNVRLFVHRLPRGCRLIAVVKADGYGHGAARVARAALEAGADGLAVSTLAEAEPLRHLVGRDRLLALGGLTPQEARAAAGAACSVVCQGREMALALSSAAEVTDPLPVHLKVDTGMGRLGCRPEEAPELACLIARSPGLRLAGVFTHFAAAENDPEYTRLQFQRFQAVLAALEVDPGLRHAANTSAVINHPETVLDAVRVGIGLYGYAGSSLRPALRLRALITQVKDIEPGESVDDPGEVGGHREAPWVGVASAAGARPSAARIRRAASDRSAA